MSRDEAIDKVTEQLVILAGQMDATAKSYAQFNRDYVALLETVLGIFAVARETD